LIIYNVNYMCFGKCEQIRVHMYRSHVQFTCELILAECELWSVHNSHRVHMCSSRVNFERMNQVIAWTKARVNWSICIW